MRGAGIELIYSMDRSYNYSLCMYEMKLTSVLSRIAELQIKCRQLLCEESIVGYKRAEDTGWNQYCHARLVCLYYRTASSPSCGKTQSHHVRLVHR